MFFNGLRLEYALEGSSNYIAWKDRMEAVLDDNKLKGIIDAEIPKPTSSDVAVLDAWKKKIVSKDSVGRCEGSHSVQPSW